jgi:hypothetical protein
MGAVEHQFVGGGGLLVETPAAPLPAVALTRTKLTLLEAFTITPMLDSPALVTIAGSAVNAISSKCAPFVRPSTSSA